jgi:hypothetical protein
MAVYGQKPRVLHLARTSEIANQVGAISGAGGGSNLEHIPSGERHNTIFYAAGTGPHGQVFVRGVGDAYSRYAAGAARTSPQGLRLPTILSEYDEVATHCRRAGRLSALSTAFDRVGTARPRSPRDRTLPPPGEVRGGQESGQFQIPRHTLVQQIAGPGVGPMRVPVAQRKSFTLGEQRS